MSSVSIFTTEPKSSAGEQRDALRTLIAPLSADQQRVCVLIYMHDLTPALVGAVLGRTESWVRQTHKRARDSLREIIDAQPGGVTRPTHARERA